MSPRGASPQLLEVLDARIAQTIQPAAGTDQEFPTEEAMIPEIDPAKLSPHTRLFIRWVLRQLISTGQSIAHANPRSLLIPRSLQPFSNLYDKFRSSQPVSTLSRGERLAVQSTLQAADKFLAHIRGELEDLALRVREGDPTPSTVGPPSSTGRRAR